MAVKDFGRKTIKTSGGELTVRGLNFEDITKLVREQPEAVELLFGEATSQIDKPAEEQNMTAMVAKALHVAPTLVASVIAAAMDETDADSLHIIRKWPVGVQMVALEAIGDLTFAVEGGAGKIFEIVMKLRDSIPSKKQASPSVSGLKELDSK